MFGGGVNAFSRYENGKTKPPLALVTLLKLRDRHPEPAQRSQSGISSRPAWSCIPVIGR
ncbi:MAG: type II toxin-antitoxin system MqsA family antitoxin [Azonexus sp.]|nr:type II toxin-antitoxin system MqsA family antitoxin [Azonexus sp.]MDP3638468.1 type II toxin-antitoxin system MqsA family antitoxin [Azonexus sp.]